MEGTLESFHTGKDRASCQSGGAPALRPGARAQSPGREAALAWASLAQRFPASSVLAREGAPRRLWAKNGSFPGSPEKAMATHSSVLAWRIPGTGEPGGLPSMGLHRVGHD